MRKAAADLEFEEAGAPPRRDPPARGRRPRHPARRSASRRGRSGNSTEGKPGTRKGRFGKQRGRGWRRAALICDSATLVQARATQSACREFEPVNLTPGMRRERGAKFMHRNFATDPRRGGDGGGDTASRPQPRGDEPVAVPRTIKQGIDFVYVDPQMSSVARRRSGRRTGWQRMFNLDFRAARRQRPTRCSSSWGGACSNIRRPGAACRRSRFRPGRR